MSDMTLPFAKKKLIEIKGRRMAYIDEGEGAPILFQHGNPSSSYLWRNVMPACKGLGRLIACDLIVMDVEKGKFREFCKKSPNQKEFTVRGIHYLQEDSGPEIGAAVAEFVRGLRKKT
jgi:hypothetical protein